MTDGIATAIELSEVENWLFGARLGPDIGREFAIIRGWVIERLVEELSLQMVPSYFYQIWEIAGDKMSNETTLTSSESAELRKFEQKLQETGATVRCQSVDSKDKSITQWLWAMCSSVRDTLEVQDAD